VLNQAPHHEDVLGE